MFLAVTLNVLFLTVLKLPSAPFTLEPPIDSKWAGTVPVINRPISRAHGYQYSQTQENGQLHILFQTIDVFFSPPVSILAIFL